VVPRLSRLPMEGVDGFGSVSSDEGQKNEYLRNLLTGACVFGIQGKSVDLKNLETLHKWKVDHATLKKLIAPSTTGATYIPLMTRAYLTLVLKRKWKDTWLVSMVAQHEGLGRFDALNRNTDGAGLSVGIIQWAQSPGRLGELVALILDSPDAEVVKARKGILGEWETDAAKKKLLKEHVQAGVKARGIHKRNWKKKFKDDPDAGTSRIPNEINLLSNEWATRFRKLLRYTSLQGFQVDQAIADFKRDWKNLLGGDQRKTVRDAFEKLRTENPAEYRQSRALLQDIANQFGYTKWAWSFVSHAYSKDQTLGDTFRTEVAKKAEERLKQLFKAPKKGQESNEVRAGRARRKFFTESTWFEEHDPAKAPDSPEPTEPPTTHGNENTLELLGASSALALSGKKAEDNSAYVFDALALKDSSPLTLVRPFVIPLDLIKEVGGSLQLNMDSDVVLFLETPLYVRDNSSADFSLFGRKFKGKYGISLHLRLRLHFDVDRDWEATPLIELMVCGSFFAAGGGGSAQVEMEAETCLIIEVPAPPELNVPELNLPKLSVQLPDVGIPLPRIPWPSWSFGKFPDLFSDDFPPFNWPDISSPVKIGVLGGRLRRKESRFTLELRGLWVETPLGRMQGNLRLRQADQAQRDQGRWIDPEESWFDLYEPDAANTRRLQFNNWQFGDQCLALEWEKAQLDDWLGLFVPEIRPSEAGEERIALQLIWGDVLECRLDWRSSDDSEKNRALDFPGFKLKSPEVDANLLVIQRAEDEIWRVAVGAVLSGEKKIEATTSFGLADVGGERSQLPPIADGNTGGDDTLVALTLQAEPSSSSTGEIIPDEPDEVFIPTEPTDDNSQEFFGLALATLEFPDGRLEFVRQFDEILPLDFEKPGMLCRAVPLATTRSLQEALWDLSLEVNRQLEVEVPLLGPDQKLSMVVRGFQILWGSGQQPVAGCQIEMELILGKVTAKGVFNAKFDWEQMSFSIKEHDGQIPFYMYQPEEDGDFLGLDWTFIGGPEQKFPVGNDKEIKGYKLFVLETKGSNFELRQAEGSVIRAEFSKATSKEEPFQFETRGFRIGPKGLSVTATLRPTPVKLQGVNTVFRFNEGILTIEDNKITGFGVSGSGTLPSSLVGHAEATVTLEFGEQNGEFDLISGSAELAGNKLLRCNSTRFNFDISKLGFEFVKENGYHFYFTLTGTAQFVPFAGDDPEGPLGWLNGITIELKECPLTDDLSVLAKHIDVKVETTKKETFKFLGLFEFEVRGIGFDPHFEGFSHPAAAMVITGQIRFAEGGGDMIDARFDFHNLYIGLPEPGDFKPQLYCKELGFALRQGSVFAIEGSVNFLDGQEVEPGWVAEGFRGRAKVTIEGLPEIGCTVAFLRARQGEDKPWVRAWFIYAEASKFNVEVPPFRLFMREIGLGFGYRYTLAMIRGADEQDNTPDLIKELDELAKRQGDLSRWDRWRLDIEDHGSANWTVVMRALLAQNSATREFNDWQPDKERELPCLFTMDAVLALRSDLTFLMVSRAWLNTNYHDFLTADPDENDSLRVRPLLTGIVLLQPRRRRFLARLRSSEKPAFGEHPPVWPMLKKAVEQSYFSSTLLIEPGLFHLEMGWPSELRWSDKIGPLNAEFRGGAIFRVSRTEVVNGINFEARGSLTMKSEVNAGAVGARLWATARVAYGARYIGVIALDRPWDNSALYAGVGLEIYVKVGVDFWIRIKLGFCKITLRFGFSFELMITALLEAGVTPRQLLGVRGTASIGIRIMGHWLRFHVHVGLNEGAVDRALHLTNRFLNVGLEAKEVEPLPGKTPEVQEDTPFSEGASPVIDAEVLHSETELIPESLDVREGGDKVEVKITCPDYELLRVPYSAEGEEEYLYLLLPKALEEVNAGEREGFLAVPPENPSPPDASMEDYDYRWQLHQKYNNLKQCQFVDGKRVWTPPNQGESGQREFKWRVHWLSSVAVSFYGSNDEEVLDHDRTLAGLMRYAYLPENGAGLEPNFGDPTPHADPLFMPVQRGVKDERVEDPFRDEMEDAVEGAVQQVEASPYLRYDPLNAYDKELREAFDNRTSIYGADGLAPQNPENGEDPETAEHTQVQQVHELRSAVLQRLLTDLEELAEIPSGNWVKEQFLALKYGLIFKVDTNIEWPEAGKIQQAVDPGEEPTLSEGRTVHFFNPDNLCFHTNAPSFEKVRKFVSDATIAIAWDLEWNVDVEGKKIEPEDHLKYYQVTRQRLDAEEPVEQYRIKEGAVLRRTAENTAIQALAPRFKLVDHFTESEDAEIGGANGKHYVYTITPIDVAGNASTRPLTVTAVRRAALPPVSPISPKLNMTFHVDPVDTLPLAEPPRMEPVFAETVLSVEDPPSGKRKGEATPENYYLVLRKEKTWPVGSYPSDADTAEGRQTGIPSSAGRRLPDDVISQKLPYVNFQGDENEADQLRTYQMQGDPATDPLQAFLRQIFPAGDWDPTAYSAFLQSESVQDVRSPLIPVELELTFARTGTEKNEENVNRQTSAEIRPVPHLEMPAKPFLLPMLPAEDGFAEDDWVAVPRHAVEAGDDANSPLVFGKGEMSTEGEFPEREAMYQSHPAQLRMVRMMWNLCATRDYPEEVRERLASLSSAYEVYEFDADQFSSDIFNRPKPLSLVEAGAALRKRTEVHLAPAEDLRLLPADNLMPDQWEAWYPSLSRRMWLRENNTDLPLSSGLDDAFSPWFSWRESVLNWPEDSHILQQQLLAEKRISQEGIRLNLLRGYFGTYKVAKDQHRDKIFEITVAKKEHSAFVGLRTLKRICAEDKSGNRITLRILHDKHVKPPKIGLVCEVLSQGPDLQLEEGEKDLLLRPVTGPASADAAFFDLEAGKLLLPVLNEERTEDLRRLRQWVNTFSNHKVPDSEETCWWLHFAAFLNRSNNGPARVTLDTKDVFGRRTFTFGEWRPFQQEVWLEKESHHELALAPWARGDHPGLVRLIDEVCEKLTERIDLKGVDPGEVPVYADLVPFAGIEASTAAEFMAATPGSADPYGWNILKQFGLSETMIFRLRSNGRMLSPDVQEQQLHEALRQVVTGKGWRETDYGEQLLRHLHIEWLVQPGRSVRGRDREPDKTFAEHQCLAPLQLSLRPTPRQTMYGHEVMLKSKDPESSDKKKLTLQVPAAPGYLLWHKNEETNDWGDAQEVLQGGTQKIDPQKKASAEFEVWSLTPLDPNKLLMVDDDGGWEVAMSVRSWRQAGKGLEKFTWAKYLPVYVYAITATYDERLGASPSKGTLKFPPPTTGFEIWHRNLSTQSDWQLKRVAPKEETVTFDGYTAKDSVQLLIRRRVPYTKEVTALPEQAWDIEQKRLAPWDELSGVFPLQTKEQLGVRSFDRLERRLRVAFPPAEGKDPEKLEAGEWMNWQNRFFEHGPDWEARVPEIPEDEKWDEDLHWPFKGGSGPWSATSYPRQPSPLPASPDGDGRIHCSLVVGDPWGHRFRYFVTPSGRYDRLWAGLLQSPGLFSDKEIDQHFELLQHARKLPKGEEGGFDVVLNRSKKVSAPVVLRSSRLDLPLKAGTAMVPGKYWEVVVEQHPEEVLSHRNRTVSRQLEFQKVIWSVFRRMESDRLTQQKDVIAFLAKQNITIQPVEQKDDVVLPRLAGVDEVSKESEDPERKHALFDLPDRMETLGVGAKVLQWESPPHWYEHRLVVAAQALKVVSPAVERVERFFAYVSPEPEGTLDAMNVTEKGRVLKLDIALPRYWDSTPEDVRKRWCFENPESVQDGKRRLLSALPDLDVLQYVVIRGSDVAALDETVAELSYDVDPANGGQFRVRGEQAVWSIELLDLDQAHSAQLPAKNCLRIGAANQDRSSAPLRLTLIMYRKPRRIPLKNLDPYRVEHEPFSKWIEETESNGEKDVKADWMGEQLPTIFPALEVVDNDIKNSFIKKRNPMRGLVGDPTAALQQLDRNTQDAIETGKFNGQILLAWTYRSEDLRAESGNPGLSKEILDAFDGWITEEPTARGFVDKLKASVDVVAGERRYFEVVTPAQQPPQSSNSVIHQRLLRADNWIALKRELRPDEVEALRKVFPDEPNRASIERLVFGHRHLAALQKVVDENTTSVPVSERREIAEYPKSRFQYVDPERFRLVWSGPMNEDEKTMLDEFTRPFKGDFLNGVETLVDEVSNLSLRAQENSRGCNRKIVGVISIPPDLSMLGDLQFSLDPQPGKLQVTWSRGRVSPTVMGQLQELQDRGARGVRRVMDALRYKGSPLWMQKGLPVPVPPDLPVSKRFRIEEQNNKVEAAWIGGLELSLFDLEALELFVSDTSQPQEWQDAIAALLTRISTASVQVTLDDVSLYPSQEDLVKHPDYGDLARKLLLAGAELQAYGQLMSQEAGGVMKKYNHVADQDAVRRLYQQSLSIGLSEIENEPPLELRARRGATASRSNCITYMEPEN